MLKAELVEVKTPEITPNKVDATFGLSQENRVMIQKDAEPLHSPDKIANLADADASFYQELT